MRQIIFITDLPLWSMKTGHGGPALSQTMNYYINRGYDVYLVSDEQANKQYGNLKPDHNIVLPPLPFKKYTQLRKIGLLFRYLNHLYISNYIVKTCEKIISDPECIIYAYEVFGVKAGRTLTEKQGRIFITRFQGTILCNIQDNFYNRMARYPHFQALSTGADLVVMTNDGTQGDRVLKELGNKSKHLFLLNGLDLMDTDINKLKSQFDKTAFRRKLGMDHSEESCMFLTVSRLEGWKRVERAIYGFSDFYKKHKAGYLVIVGEGTERKNLEEKAKENGVEKHVIFVGSVAHDKVYDYMLACDVFLSLYDLSNVGNPLLEAMTLGKCIITYDVGDTNKFIINGKNGILLNKNNLNELGDVMACLARRPKTREQLGKEASIYAHQNFWSWKKRMEYEESQLLKLTKNEVGIGQ